MGKPKAFRPSEKSEQAINFLLKEKKAKNISDAVNQLIEKGIDSEGSQSEQPQEGDFFSLPPWIYCWFTGQYSLRETLLAPKEGQCYKCEHRSSCPSWKRGV